MGGEVVQVGVLRERLVKELVFKSYYMLGTTFVVTNVGRSYCQSGKVILLQIRAALLEIGRGTTNWGDFITNQSEKS